MRHRPRLRVELKRGLVGGEIEHARQVTGLLVERVIPDAAGVPVVLDELQNRGLIGQRVVDVVRLRVGRDDQQRQPRAETAPALRKLAAQAGAKCEVRLTVLTDGREDPQPPLCREIQISVKTAVEAPQKESRYDSPAFAGRVRILAPGYKPAGRPLAGGPIAVHYSEEIIVGETFDSSLIWKIIGTPFTLALDAVCVGGIIFLELGRLDIHVK